MAEPVYRTAVTAGHLLLRALDLRVDVVGLEHLPRRGPVLLAANHVSFLDFLLVGLAGRRRGRWVRFLARHDVWQHPVAGPAMTAMRHVPVDRAAPAAAFLRARSALRAGEAVGVFPEAGVSTSFTVRAMMPGAVALAAATGAPVVPVALWGPQRLWTAGLPRDLARHRPVSVRLGVPVVVPPDADPVAGTQALGRTLQRMLDDLQAMPGHQPAPGERPAWHPAHLGGGAPSVSAARASQSLPGSAVSPGAGPLPAR